MKYNAIDDEYYQFDDDEFIIKSEVEGIEIPYNFYKKLNEIFFNKYYSKKICQYETARNDIYIVISCNSELFTNNSLSIFLYLIKKIISPFFMGLK